LKTNKTWSETLSEFNTWGPVGVLGTIGAAAIATPIIAPTALALAAGGAVVAVAGSAAKIVHSNNARAVAELGYGSQTQRIAGPSPRYTVEYPDD
jgi:hypothetical protein